MGTIIPPTMPQNQPPQALLAKSLAMAVPGPFFTDAGIPQRVRAPGHVESHLARMEVEGMQGLRLDTLEVFNTPVIRQLAKPSPEIPAWKSVAEKLAETWNLDEIASQELTRWLVWHGFIREDLLAPHDLPELADTSELRAQRPPVPPGYHQRDWNHFQFTRGRYLGYLGELNGWRAAYIDRGQGLELECSVRTFRLKVNTRTGSRGYYAYVSAREFWGQVEGKPNLPAWFKEMVRQMVYIADAEDDGKLYVHRLLAVLWFDAEVNPGGISGRVEPDHLQVHHWNSDSLDNRIVNLLPVTLAQHQALHAADWE